MSWLRRIFHRWCPQRLFIDDDWAKSAFSQRQRLGDVEFPCEHCTPLEPGGYAPCSRHYGPRTVMF